MASDIEDDTVIRSPENLTSLLERCNVLQHRATYKHVRFDENPDAYTAFLDALIENGCDDTIESVPDSIIRSFAKGYWSMWEVQQKNIQRIRNYVNVTLESIKADITKRKSKPNTYIFPVGAYDVKLRQIKPLLNAMESKIFSSPKHFQIVPVKYRQRILVSVMDDYEKLTETEVGYYKSLMKTLTTRWLLSKYFPTLNRSALSHSHGTLYTSVCNLLKLAGVPDSDSAYDRAAQHLSTIYWTKLYSGPPFDKNKKKEKKPPKSAAQALRNLQYRTMTKTKLAKRVDLTEQTSSEEDKSMDTDNSSDDDCASSSSTEFFRTIEKKKLPNLFVIHSRPKRKKNTEEAGPSGAPNIKKSKRTSSPHQRTLPEVQSVEYLDSRVTRVFPNRPTPITNKENVSYQKDKRADNTSTNHYQNEERPASPSPETPLKDIVRHKSLKNFEHKILTGRVCSIRIEKLKTPPAPTHTNLILLPSFAGASTSGASVHQQCDDSRTQDVTSLQIENAGENNLIEDNIEVKQEPSDNTILQSDERQASFTQPLEENETLQTMPPEPVRMTRTNDTNVELSRDQLEAHRLDDNYHFLISLLPHIKTLPAEQQMLLRIQMQELVYKKVYEKNTDENC